MPTAQSIRRFLWRWHRRLGLAAALFLSWLAISGVFLNHTAWLGLSKVSLPKSLASSVFPIQQFDHYQSGHTLGVFTQTKQTLFLNDKSVTQCEDALIGIIDAKDGYWVACSKQLIMLDPQGLYADNIDQYFGLPVPVSKIGACQNSVCIESVGRQYQLNQQTDEWLISSSDVKWHNTINNTTKRELSPEIHNWERFMLEAHSGRIFGNAGVILFDIIALFCILLALSGCYVWWVDYRRRQK